MNCEGEFEKSLDPKEAEEVEAREEERSKEAEEKEPALKMGPWWMPMEDVTEAGDAQLLL